MVDLRVDLCGIRFPNPILVAAGTPSRDGDTLLKMAKGGAGGLVTKTVSTNPAKVPKPNMMVPQRGELLHEISTVIQGKLVKASRVKIKLSQALLNTELWSEKPLEDWLNKEYDIALSSNLPVIASIGYSPAQVREIGPLVEKKGVSAIEFSLHYLGKSLEPLVDTAKSLRNAVSIPIFPKISPNVPDVIELVQALEPYVDGFVAINSLGPTLTFDIDKVEPVLGSKYGFGWISGAPIKPLALRIVFDIARSTKRPVIGVGGVLSGSDVVEFLMAGASMVQICTGAILEGPSIFGRVVRELEEWLEEHDFTSVKDIQGLYLRSLKDGQDEVVERVATVVDEEKCKTCGLCVKTCVSEALSIKEENGRSYLFLDEDCCVGCGLCYSLCPTHALSKPFPRI